MSGRRNSLQGKKGDDPEWVKEIVSRPITSKEQEITDKYKKLFRDLYLDYLRDGLKPNFDISITSSGYSAFVRGMIFSSHNIGEN